MMRRLLVGVVAAALALGLVPAAAAAQNGASTSVVNGQEASAGTYPYMAFVLFENGVEGEICSGTLVSSNVVLTAAHCVLSETFSVLRSPANLTVVTGNVDWASPVRTVSGVSAVAADPSLAWTVPGYLPVRGDAAVLKLSSPVAAPSIELATTQTWNPGTGAVMVGWGRTTPSGTAVETLHVGEGAVQTPEYCASKFSHFESAWSLCVLDPDYRYSACNGDSGGPLLTTGSSGEPLEIGIASYGDDECPTDEPQVYTRADAVAGWVAQKVGEWAPPPAPAQVATPTTTPAPNATPAPAPAVPTLPVMSRSQATTYAIRALQLGMGGHFRGHRGYRVTCSNSATSSQRCSVSWTRGTYYYGTVAVFYEYEGDRLVWGDRFRIHKLERCNHQRCPRRLYQS